MEEPVASPVPSTPAPAPNDRPVFHFVFFGFARHLRPKRLPVRLDPGDPSPPVDVRLYVFAPVQMYEDRGADGPRFDADRFRSVLLDASGQPLPPPHFVGTTEVVLRTWNYEAAPFDAQAATEPSVPRANEFGLMPQRMLSMYYHVREALRLLPPAETWGERDVVVLHRLDNALDACDVGRILALLGTDGVDVIVDRDSPDHYRPPAPRGVADHYFVFRKRALPAFLDLYDSFMHYAAQWETNANGIRARMGSTRPEDTYVYHLQDAHRLGVVRCPVLSSAYEHVCSPYCDHHRAATFRQWQMRETNG